MRTPLLALLLLASPATNAGFYDGDAPDQNNAPETRQEQRPQLDGLTQRVLDSRAEVRAQREQQIRAAGKGHLWEAREDFAKKNSARPTPEMK